MFKIAVIDDNRAMAEMIATTIRWGDIDCTICGTAYDGVRGRTLIQKEKPEIIIADIRMPGLDGLEMIRAAQASDPKAKVIFISAYDDFSYAQEAVRLHAYEYLLKPFDNTKLVESVRRAVSELRGEELPASEELSANETLIKRILHYVDTHPEHPTLQEISDHFGFSASYISSLVKKETGENYIDWVVRSRMNKAKRLLKDPKYRIEEVAYAVGYKNYISFYQMFVKYEGISPRDYRIGGEKK